MSSPHLQNDMWELKGAGAQPAARSGWLPSPAAGIMGTEVKLGDSEIKGCL